MISDIPNAFFAAIELLMPFVGSAQKSSEREGFSWLTLWHTFQALHDIASRLLFYRRSGMAHMCATGHRCLGRTVTSRQHLNNVVFSDSDSIMAASRPYSKSSLKRGGDLALSVNQSPSGLCNRLRTVFETQSHISQIITAIGN
jgi:hypothetical protein